jgi:hypothetical protein
MNIEFGLDADQLLACVYSQTQHIVVDITH